MLKQYKEEILLRTYNCDFNGQWKPSAIMETMQEIAGMHSELIGVGRNALMQKNLVWILTRVEVDMDRYPRIGETVEVETYPMPVRRWFFPRYFIFRDASGAEVGRAGSLWALMDVTSRKMAPPAGIISLLPDNSDLLAPLGLPGPVTEVSGTLQVCTHMPEYTDLDVNMHVNNTKYMDWLCNALGIKLMREKCLQSFRLNFDMEVRPGQELRMELRQLGDAFSFCGFHGEERHFDIGGLLGDRK